MVDFIVYMGYVLYVSQSVEWFLLSVGEQHEERY